MSERHLTYLNQLPIQTPVRDEQGRPAFFRVHYDLARFGTDPQGGVRALHELGFDFLNDPEVHVITLRHEDLLELKRIVDLAVESVQTRPRSP
ncbi:MAG: hypothetical protein AAGN66_07030 [Acidobacteriota bacterium]